MIDYEDLERRSVRRIMRDALSAIAKTPGCATAYLTFQTAGASLNPKLRERYPHEMTIVLQHQFWDLEVRENDFSVVLRFSGVPEKLEISWSAMTRYYDPDAQYLIQVEPEVSVLPPLRDPEPGPGDGKVVSLADRRKS